jgi:hypothetical protein
MLHCDINVECSLWFHGSVAKYAFMNPTPRNSPAPLPNDTAIACREETQKQQLRATRPEFHGWRATVRTVEASTIATRCGTNPAVPPQRNDPACARYRSPFMRLAFDLPRDFVLPKTITAARVPAFVTGVERSFGGFVSPTVNEFVDWFCITAPTLVTDILADFGTTRFAPTAAPRRMSEHR